MNNFVILNASELNKINGGSFKGRLFPTRPRIIRIPDLQGYSYILG